MKHKLSLTAALAITALALLSVLNSPFSKQWPEHPGFKIPLEISSHKIASGLELPAGLYRLQLGPTFAEGVKVGIQTAQGFWDTPLLPYPHGGIEFQLPIRTRGLSPYYDSSGDHLNQGCFIEPLQRFREICNLPYPLKKGFHQELIPGSQDRPDFWLYAVKGTFYPIEGTGFWTGGRSKVTLYLISKEPLPPLELRLHSLVESEGQITLQGARESVPLKPGEETRVLIRLKPWKKSPELWIYSLSVQSSQGIQPGKLDPENMDFRVLGLYCRFPPERDSTWIKSKSIQKGIIIL